MGRDELLRELQRRPDRLARVAIGPWMVDVSGVRVDGDQGGIAVDLERVNDAA